MGLHVLVALFETMWMLAWLTLMLGTLRLKEVCSIDVNDPSSVAFRE